MVLTIFLFVSFIGMVICGCLYSGGPDDVNFKLKALSQLKFSIVVFFVALLFVVLSWAL